MGRGAGGMFGIGRIIEGGGGELYIHIDQPLHFPVQFPSVYTVQSICPRAPVSSHWVPPPPLNPPGYGAPHPLTPLPRRLSTLPCWPPTMAPWNHYTDIILD